MTEKKEVQLFTDGACSGNPGPGGWGAILRYKGQEKELSGGEANTTNNRMEMTALLEALRQQPHGAAGRHRGAERPEATLPRYPYQRQQVLS